VVQELKPRKNTSLLYVNFFFYSETRATV